MEYLIKYQYIKTKTRNYEYILRFFRITFVEIIADNKKYIMINCIILSMTFIFYL